MARLTIMQIEHLQARISEAFNKLINAEINKLGDTPQVLSYTKDEMLKLIQTGKAKLREDADIASHHHKPLSSYFIFPVTKAQAASKQKREAYDEKVKTIRRRFDEEKRRLEDQAILGDSESALNMIKGLELRVSKA